LRVQNCVMLKGAKGFDQQTNDNKLMQSPYVAAKNPTGDRWIITAWQPIHRPWATHPALACTPTRSSPTALPVKLVSYTDGSASTKGTTSKAN